jgi:tRNA uridine 5-carboxymethylaminomethyl modification enzyme
MFTSRAEFRTLLRQDNADLRLTELSFRIGLASQQRMQKVLDKKTAIEKTKELLSSFSLEPEESANYLLEKNSAPLLQKQKAAQVLLRPNIDLISMRNAIPRLAHSLDDIDTAVLEETEIQIKYDVYIGKEKELVAKMAQLEDLLIPENFNYDRLSSLYNEALQKFKKIKPRTLGQASRISGVNPSDVQILMVYMGR